MSNDNSLLDDYDESQDSDEIIIDETITDKAARKREKNHKALFTRRAVEDLLERKRFLQEFNYLYEDELSDFSE